MKFFEDYSDCLDLTVAKALARTEALAEASQADHEFISMVTNTHQALSSVSDLPVREISVKDRSILMSFLNEANLFQISHTESADRRLDGIQPRIGIGSCESNCLSEHHQRLDSGYPGNSQFLYDMCMVSCRPDPPQGSGALILYEHENFRGRELVLRLGRHRHLAKWNFDRMTSSFKLTKGMSAILFSQMDFQGKSSDHDYRKGGRAEMRSQPLGNDGVSSVIVY